MNREIRDLLNDIFAGVQQQQQQEPTQHGNIFYWFSYCTQHLQYGHVPWSPSHLNIHSSWKAWPHGYSSTMNPSDRIVSRQMGHSSENNSNNNNSINNLPCIIFRRTQITIFTPEARVVQPHCKQDPDNACLKLVVSIATFSKGRPNTVPKHVNVSILPSILLILLF